MTKSDLTETQRKALKDLISAKKRLEKSGLQLILVDEFLNLFKKEDDITFRNVTEKDSYMVNDFSLVSYGL